MYLKHFANCKHHPQTATKTGGWCKGVHLLSITDDQIQHQGSLLCNQPNVKNPNSCGTGMFSKELF